MDRVKNFALNFIREEEGATMVEYGIMVALIAAICVVIVTALGKDVQGAFDKVEDAINGSQAAP
jgi:pilus assembly protein Flp/PilA